jgi:hypothetical protein
MYSLNKEKIISEVFDGETVMINLDTGSYYATNTTGSVILKLIEKQVDIDKKIEDYFILNEIKQEVVSEELSEYLNSLLKENIIVESRNGAVPTMSSNEEKISYVKPELSCFTDMQELILLDPIHEVSDEGWPAKKN